MVRLQKLAAHRAQERHQYVREHRRCLAALPDCPRSLEVLAGGLLWVRWPFEVIDSPELAALLRDRAAAFAADPR